jgi:hypothetical protein
MFNDIKTIFNNVHISKESEFTAYTANEIWKNIIKSRH